MRQYLNLSVASALLLGCATPATPPSDAALVLETLVGSSWVAKEHDNAGPPDGTTPRLQFVSVTQVRGSGGCNSFGGKAAIAGQTLRLGPLASTRKMCLGPAMQREDAFLQALDNARSAKMDNGQLVLMDAAGAAILRLSRAD